MMTAATLTAPIQRRQAPIYALFTANAISLIGSQLTLIAIPWFVLVTTGSAAKTGITAFIEALSAVIAAFFGGALVDRIGHKRASILADLVSGAIVALIPLLHHTVGLAFWQLLALVFLRSFCDTPGNTARSALRPEAVALAGIPPERANAAIQGISRGARLLGAPLAGALVALLGASDVLWLDAASFGASALLVATLLPATAIVQGTRERLVSTITAGFRFIRRDRVLLAIAVTVAITNFLDGPLFAVIMPVYVRQTFGNAVNLGLMIAAFSGGALLGVVIYGAIGARLPRRATFIGAFIMASLPFSVLVFLPPMPVILGALLLSGISGSPVNPIIETVKQERVPVELRGRVFGTITAIAFVAIPLGMMLGGFVVEWAGVRASLAIIAVGYLATTLSLLVVPAFRDMERQVNAECGVRNAE